MPASGRGGVNFGTPGLRDASPDAPNVAMDQRTGGGSTLQVVASARVDRGPIAFPWPFRRAIAFRYLQHEQ